MATFNIYQTVDLGLNISVEADTEEEAVGKVERAWRENGDFVKGYLRRGDVLDTGTECACGNSDCTFDEVVGIGKNW